MEVIGQIDIGTKIFQVDHLSDGFSFEAPVGSFIFDSLQNVVEKKSKKPTDWQRTTFRVMMMNMLSWSITLLESEIEDRAEMVELILNSIALYKKGEPSLAGDEARGFLERECKLIGFIPSVTYIMPKERGEGSLDVFWEHPFSTPTLLYKHQKYPFLIISNGNIDFDDSRLKKMTKISKIHVDGLQDDDQIEEEHQDILGITG